MVAQNCSKWFRCEAPCLIHLPRHNEFAVSCVVCHFLSLSRSSSPLAHTNDVKNSSLWVKSTLRQHKTFLFSALSSFASFERRFFSFFAGVADFSTRSFFFSLFSLFVPLSLSLSHPQQLKIPRALEEEICVCVRVCFRITLLLIQNDTCTCVCVCRNLSLNTWAFEL
jgi:hypothetical protein